MIKKTTKPLKYVLLISYFYQIIVIDFFIITPKIEPQNVKSTTDDINKVNRLGHTYDICFPHVRKPG